MQELDQKQTINLLNEIIECELSGVVRYTQYSLMVTGPYRITIVDFLKEQASESLLHAQKVGEILTGLEGRPSLQILPADETDKDSVKDILAESLAHEEKALRLYKNLLETVTNSSIYLEQFARNMIGEEEMHNIELKKMLRDFTE
ncbi:ferritin-like domain-containing protein [Brasilonema bromeliae]|uniref:Bacterioferritin n=1 Tax=Brasilonema bromeliae SPC951 TaxID=385972 RepID=A0ABX1P4P2_9CYAN|nr:ferritin-like domain-containing protein [Brasilonema bromeliae]NMG19302.1 bacterioferritin [Brasilonema bromeliae SPC951]